MHVILLVTRAVAQRELLASHLSRPLGEGAVEQLERTSGEDWLEAEEQGQPTPSIG